jgi:hypothetical protein
LLTYTLHGWSQVPGYSRIFSDKDESVFVASSGVNYRVGNAVATRIFTLGRAFNWSERFLLACDGSWLSTGFNFNSHDTEGSTAERLYLARKEENQSNKHAIFINQPGESDLTYSAVLLARSKQLCSTALPEIRNQPLPVASTATGDGGEVISLLTGTSVRTQTNIEIWVRRDAFQNQEQRLPDGTVYRLPSGKIFYQRNFTGQYKLTRQVIDCRKNMIGALQHIEYKSGGQVESSTSVDRSKLQLEATVPDSIGEAVYEWACRLYSN